jgi:hypothetical protein
VAGIHDAGGIRKVRLRLAIKRITLYASRFENQSYSPTGRTARIAPMLRASPGRLLHDSTSDLVRKFSPQAGRNRRSAAPGRPP